MIQYREIKPYAPLNEYIKCIWMLENKEHSDHTEFIFPDGSMELVFHYGTPFKRILANGDSYVQARTLLVGQLSSRINLQATGSLGMIGVRFFPWGAQSFMQVPLHELTDLDFSMELVFGNGIRELEEQIGESNLTDAVKIIQQFLMARLQKNHTEYHSIKHVVQQLRSNQGNCTIANLAWESNLSVRQFNRRFTQSVGLSPKNFAGIVRFQHFFKLAQQQPDADLGLLAHASGYYDQSHFIRDFKHYTQLSPKEYFKNERELTGLFLS